MCCRVKIDVWVYFFLITRKPGKRFDNAETRTNTDKKDIPIGQ